MDKVLTGQMALGGVLKSNFNQQAQKSPADFVETIKVPVNKIIIAGVDGHTTCGNPAASRRRLLEDNSGVMVDFIVSKLVNLLATRL